MSHCSPSLAADDRPLLFVNQKTIPFLQFGQPRMVISITSGETPKVRARPFFASAIVSGLAPGYLLTSPVSELDTGVAGMGSHFRSEGLMPRSSISAYLTGFLSPFHTSGIFSSANSLNWIRYRPTWSEDGTTPRTLPTRNAEW